MSSSPGTILPAADAFGRTAPLAFSATLPVTGVPLQVRSNAEAALQLAERTFGVWRTLDPALVAAGEAARLDIVVHGDALDAPASAPLTYRRHGDVFMAAGAGVLATVHLATRQAVVFVSPSVLDAHDWFMAHVNGLGLLAATQRDRVPIHAAAILHHGVAIVIMGPSGAGKSTLTYACHDAGAAALTDDTVFVSLEGTPRLWGHAEQAWIAPDAVRFFPRLAAHPIVTRTNGKRRIAAPLAREAGPMLAHAGPVVVVLLERSTGQVHLAPVQHDDMLRALSGDVDDGFDQYHAWRAPVVAWLAGQPAYRLAAGDDPCAAAAHLLDTVAGVVR